MKTDDDLMGAQRRLTILQLLQKDPDYRLNDAMLQELLGMRGHGVSMARVRADLVFLEQSGLIVVQELPGCSVAILRNDGVDAASGVSQFPGVARPRPE